MPRKRILRNAFTARTAPAVLVGFALCLGACNPDVMDGVGPLIPFPDLTGRIVRDASPADDVEVELREIETAAVVDSAETDGTGRFEFYDVAAGAWELKVSGDTADDFDSVTWIFEYSESQETSTLPDIDIFAHGAGVLAPENAAELPTPIIINEDSYVTFRWTLPSTPFNWARVKLYDEEGETVWSSPKENVDSVIFTGLTDSGGLISPGNYTWRVKFELADSLEARLDPREIEFTASAKSEDRHVPD
jgi:hypothetical protein